jgi:hypothetical protein
VKLAAGRDGDPTTVLNRRADLRPAPPARARTATFAANVAVPMTPPAPVAPVPPARTLVTPAGEPADQGSRTPAPAAIPRPAAPPPSSGGTEPPHHEIRPERRRRPPMLWVAIGLVTAALAGLIVFWVVALDDTSGTSGTSGSGSGGTAAATSQPGSGTPETGGAPAQAADQTSEAATTTTSSAPTDPLTAANITDFLQSYHQQVQSDPAAAWARTGPTLRAAIGSEQAYANFWNQFSDVRLSDVQASDGNNVATGTLALVYPNGTSDTGRHVFTFIVQNGQLVLDSDTR